MVFLCPSMDDRTSNGNRRPVVRRSPDRSPPPDLPTPEGERWEISAVDREEHVSGVTVGFVSSSRWISVMGSRTDGRTDWT